MLYLFLILSIVSVVLFAFVSKELKKCNTSLSNFDSGIVLCVFVGIIAEFILIGKKLYDNKQQLPSLRASSPNRASYVDPFGLDLPRQESPNRPSYVDPFGLDLPRQDSPNRASYVDPFGLDLPRQESPNRASYVDPFGLDF
jgi:hypothetical protein